MQCTLKSSIILMPFSFNCLLPISNISCSKRKFSSQQAEEWWTNNKDRLLKRYSQLKARASPAPSLPPSSPVPAAEENNEAALPSTI